MTVSKQCVCGSKDVAIIHDLQKKELMPYNALNVIVVGQQDLERMSETSRFIVKKCGQEMESPPKILEHIVLVHNDPDAAELLQEVQVPAYLQGLLMHQYYVSAINCNIISIGDSVAAVVISYSCPYVPYRNESTSV